MTDHQNDQPTRQTEPERVPSVPSGKSTAAGRRRAGNSLGGKAKRAVAVIGLGLPADQMPDVDLSTAASQVAILEGVVRALALGLTSGLVASGIVSAVRAAAEITRSDQSALLQAQYDEIERLRAGGVVDVRRR